MKSFLHWIKSKVFISRRGSATVRYMFPAAILVAAALGAAVITSTDASYVKLEANKSAVPSGDRFTVDVYVFANEPVNAIDITVEFDSKAVEVLEVDRGQSVITIWTEDPVVEANRVIFSGGTFRKGFLGEHKIASIDMRATGVGASTLQVSDILLLAGDGQGSEVINNSEGTGKVQLYVYDKNADPATIKALISVNIITDIDGDGRVTLKDISAFMGAWSSKSVVYDFNNDGKMSFRDFSIILGDFFLGR